MYQLLIIPDSCVISILMISMSRYTAFTSDLITRVAFNLAVSFLQFYHAVSKFMNRLRIITREVAMIGSLAGIRVTYMNAQHDQARCFVIAQHWNKKSEN